MQKPPSSEIINSNQSMNFLPIEQAPKDGRTILALCIHSAAPCYCDDRTTLTPYAAWAEIGHCQDGWQIVAWHNGDPGGPANDDYPMPGWWFALDPMGEISDKYVAYPVFGIELPWPNRSVLTSANK